MDNKYNVVDLINFATSQKPNEFENAFNSIIVDRLQTAVEDKKFEVAQNMYSVSDFTGE